jgi:hypothetical protein
MPAADTDVMSYLMATQQFLLLGLALYVYFAFFLMVLARKTDTDHSWLAWIPIANLYLMCAIARRSPLWMLLLLVPVVNILAFLVLWSSIARVRGKPGWIGLLMIVPGVNLLVPPYLAAGASTAAEAPPALAVADVPQDAFDLTLHRRPVRPPVVCPQCGTRTEPKARFCGECGFTLALASLSQPAPPTPSAPAPPPPEDRPRRSLAPMLAGLAVVALVVAGAAYFVLGGSPAAGPRQPPALPSALAGTLTEFPIDTASERSLRPDAVVTQQIASATASVNVPPDWLPPGVSAPSLAGRANAVTAATYRARPEDAPVSVAVLSTPDADAVELGRAIGQQVAAAGGGRETGIRVQSPEGETYTGTRISNDRQTTYVLVKDNATAVVLVYAADPSAAPAAERLAANIGNGEGLIADPVIQESIGCLPPRVPEDLVLQEAQTTTGAQLGEASAQLGNLAARLGPEGQRWVAQAQSILPQQLLSARYQDADRQDWNVIRGQYGSPVRALATWALLRWTLGIAGGESVPLRTGSGQMTAVDGQRLLLFRTGASLVLLVAPAGSSTDKIRQLADGIQL